MRLPSSATRIVVAVWLVSTILWLTPGITYPDGAGYYSYLPSIVLGPDLVFFDEWERFGLIRGGAVQHKEITATGHLGNHWTIGSSIAWLPGFVTGQLLQPFTGAPANGLSLPYNVGVLTMNGLIALAALLLSMQVVRRIVPDAPAVLPVLAGWFGTPLLFYATRNGISPHVLASAASVVCLWTALTLRGDVTRSRMISFGLATGFAFAVRPQLAPLALIPLFVVPSDRWRTLFRHASAATAAALLASLPQWLVSYFVYGHLFGFLGVGSEARPFAALERIWWWEPLFSWYHGLFTWTPVALLGITGLVVMLRRDRGVAAAGLYLFVIQWIVNATMERSFWGAWSFGQRRFDTLLPFFILGIAALAARLRRTTTILTVIFCCWTMAIFLATAKELNLSAFYTPGELMVAAGNALKSFDDLLMPLAFVPASARMVVAVLFTASLLLLLAMAAALSRLLVRRSAGNLAASILLAAVSVTVVLASRNGGAMLERYSPVIALSRERQRVVGGADARVGLLADELSYLRKSGRTELADETERELQALVEGQARGVTR